MLHCDTFAQPLLQWKYIKVFSVLPHYHIPGMIFFGGGITEYKKCVLIFPTIFLYFVDCVSPYNSC